MSSMLRLGSSMEDVLYYGLAPRMDTLGPAAGVDRCRLGVEEMELRDALLIYCGFQISLLCDQEWLCGD